MIIHVQHWRSHHRIKNQIELNFIGCNNDISVYVNIRKLLWHKFSEAAEKVR